MGAVMFLVMLPPVTPDAPGRLRGPIGSAEWNGDAEVRCCSVPFGVPQETEFKSPSDTTFPLVSGL